VYELLRQLAANTDVALTTCGEYLSRYPPQGTVQLSESSWGAGGDHRVWWQEGTRSLWRDLYQAECDMQGLGRQTDGKRLGGQLARIVRQCGRELLLLQASDWPFMISTGSTPDHAERRASLHYNDFQRLRLMAESYMAGETVAEEDWRLLDERERQNSPFLDIDPNVFWNGKYHVAENAALCQGADQPPRPDKARRRATKVTKEKRS
jgi:1,4-alpha-glucan branching enzyme